MKTLFKFTCLMLLFALLCTTIIPQSRLIKFDPVLFGAIVLAFIVGSILINKFQGIKSFFHRNANGVFTIIALLLFSVSAFSQFTDMKAPPAVDQSHTLQFWFYHGCLYIFY